MTYLWKGEWITIPESYRRATSESNDSAFVLPHNTVSSRIGLGER